MNEFSIYHIFRLLAKNFLIIVLAALICGAAAFCYCEFKLEERYGAKGSVLVTTGGILPEDAEKIENTQMDKERIANSDIAASINFLDTFRGILDTKEIYEQLSKKLDGKYSAGQLKNFATISKRDDNSLFIDVRFEMNDPEEVVKVTNMFLDLVPNYMEESFNGSHTKVYDCDPIGKTYPRTFPTTALAMVIGAIVTFVIIYIISLFNTTIQSEEEFKNRYNIPVLGDIPDFTTAKSGKYAKSYYKGGSYYGN